MRTTLDIDEDVLLAAKELARLHKTSLGRAVSMLLRNALSQPKTRVERNGVPMFPASPGGEVVTPELVRRLLDSEWL